MGVKSSPSPGTSRTVCTHKEQPGQKAGGLLPRSCRRAKSLPVLQALEPEISGYHAYDGRSYAREKSNAGRRLEGMGCDSYSSRSSDATH